MTRQAAAQISANECHGISEENIRSGKRKQDQVDKVSVYLKNIRMYPQPFLTHKLTNIVSPTKQVTLVRHLSFELGCIESIMLVTMVIAITTTITTTTIITTTTVKGTTTITALVAAPLHKGVVLP